MSDAIRADDAARADLGAPEWDDSAPTRADVKALGRRAAHAARQGALAAWKAAHPEFRGSDATAWALVEIEQMGKRAATAADPRAGQTQREEPNSNG